MTTEAEILFMSVPFWETGFSRYFTLKFIVFRQVFIAQYFFYCFSEL